MEQDTPQVSKWACGAFLKGDDAMFCYGTMLDVEGIDDIIINGVANTAAPLSS